MGYDNVGLLGGIMFVSTVVAFFGGIFLIIYSLIGG